MALPDSLPCKCTNPQCGSSFLARNPVGGSGGINSCFTGNSTNCPKCGKSARYADWSTDSQGNFHLHGVFDFVRNIKDTNSKSGQALLSTSYGDKSVLISNR